MSCVFLSCNANRLLRDFIADRGHRIIDVGSSAPVDPAVSSHPDIYLCRISDEIIVAPSLLHKIREQLADISFKSGERSPSGAYPDDIPYNGVCFGRFFMHNLKHTDPVIIQKASEIGLTPVHVKQGYTGCSTVVVDENSIITADLGIAAAAARHGIDTLPIGSGHVRLDGHAYGFLGGASGRIGRQILFNGDLSCHPDYESICRFISGKGLEPIYFKEYPLEDIGSVIAIEPKTPETLDFSDNPTGAPI